MSQAFLDGIEKLPIQNKIDYFLNEFKRMIEAMGVDRNRMQRNFKLYSGVNNQQWDDDSVATLIEQKRPITSFNLIQKNVDIVLGTVLQNLFDIEFDPIQPFNTNNVNVVQQLFEYDNDRCDYDSERYKFILNGLIHTGVMEMYKDYRYDSLGNISWRSLNPFHVFADHYWQSDDERDCRIVYKTSWKTAQQISDEYNVDNDEINAAIESNNKLGHDYSTDTINKAADRSFEFWDAQNSRYRVIEAVYMKRMRKKRLFNKETRRFMNIDDSTVQSMMIRLQGDSLILVPEEYSICKIFTFAPGLSNSIALADGDHPVQVGRLPFLFWSSKNMFGERQGLVDVLADAQITLNKRESILTHLQNVAANGSEFIEEDLFIDDSEKIRYVMEKNKPGSVFTVSSGAINQNKQSPVKRTEVPQDFVQTIQRAESYMEKMTNLVAAAQGRSEGANESSLLFNDKKSQSQIPFEPIYKGLKRVDAARAEMYFFFMKIVYRDIPRVFKNKKTKQLIPINQRISEDSTLNDIMELPRQSILIKESMHGYNKKKEMLSKYVELSRTMGNSLLKSHYEIGMIEYLGLPEGKTKQMMEDGMLFIELQKTQAKTQIAQLNASLGQLSAQTQQQEQEVPGAREISSAQGQGNLPNNLAGGQNVSNNRQAPSDML